MIHTHVYVSSLKNVNNIIIDNVINLLKLKQYFMNVMTTPVISR